MSLAVYSLGTMEPAFSLRHADALGLKVIGVSDILFRVTKMIAINSNGPGGSYVALQRDRAVELVNINENTSAAADGDLHGAMGKDLSNGNH